MSPGRALSSAAAADKGLFLVPAAAEVPPTDTKRVVGPASTDSPSTVAGTEVTPADGDEGPVDLSGGPGSSDAEHPARMRNAAIRTAAAVVRYRKVVSSPGAPAHAPVGFRHLDVSVRRPYLLRPWEKHPSSRTEKVGPVRTRLGPA